MTFLVFPFKSDILIAPDCGTPVSKGLLNVDESFTRYLPKLMAVPVVSPSGAALPNSSFISSNDICPVGVVIL